MRYYKMIIDGYLVAVGSGSGGTEIAEADYNNLLEIIRNKPIAESGYDYRLKSDLTWELCELPPMPIEDEEISDTEALNIITGGAQK